MASISHGAGAARGRRRLRARAAALAGLACVVVGASVGQQPLADAQAAPEPPALVLRVVTAGAAGGPFRLALTRDLAPAGPAVEVEAATTAEGEAVDVTGLPSPLAPDTYHLGVVAGTLPAAPSGGTWGWSGLTCDDEDVGIDLGTGQATIPLPAGAAPTCVATMTWTPDPAAVTLATQAQPEPDPGTTTTAAPDDPTTTTTGTTTPDDTTTTTGTTVPDPAGVAAAEDDPIIVPLADATHGTFRITKAGGRTGSTGLTPLAGATMGVYATRADATNRVNPVATCVTGGVDGSCSVDLLAGISGTTYFVREISPPPGYYRIDNIVAGPYYAPVLEPYIEQATATRNNITSVPAMQQVYQGSPIERRFANPLNNPLGPDVCGVDVAFIVDTSSSVSSSEMTQLKNAAREAVGGLVGTPTRLAMYSFDTRVPGTGAPPNLPLTSVLANANVVNGWINGLPQDTGTFNYTNWDRGLLQAAASPDQYDLALFLTDGNPTVWGPAGDREGTTVSSARSATEQAVASANALKAEGTRIIGVGIGSDELFIDSIRSISGPNPDDAFATDFDELAALLRELATAGCQGSVTVVKQTRPTPTGAFTVAPGWTISTPTSGVTPTSAVTDTVGATNFGIDFGTTPVTRSVSFSETLQPGYSLVQQGGFNARCTTNNGATVLPVTNAGPLGFTISVAPTAIVTCVIQNQQVPPRG